MGGPFNTDTCKMYTRKLSDGGIVVEIHDEFDNKIGSVYGVDPRGLRATWIVMMAASAQIVEHGADDLPDDFLIKI